VVARALSNKGASRCPNSSYPVRGRLDDQATSRPASGPVATAGSTCPPPVWLLIRMSSPTGSPASLIHRPNTPPRSRPGPCWSRPRARRGRWPPTAVGIGRRTSTRSPGAPAFPTHPRRRSSDRPRRISRPPRPDPAGSRRPGSAHPQAMRHGFAATAPGTEISCSDPKGWPASSKARAIRFTANMGRPHGRRGGRSRPHGCGRPSAARTPRRRETRPRGARLVPGCAGRARTWR
jgi:hypothetical protein